MPIKKSAMKALRKSTKTTVKNRNAKIAIKKMIKRGRAAILENRLEEAKVLAPKLSKAVDKAAKKNIIKKNRANRIKSRFAKSIKKATRK